MACLFFICRCRWVCRCPKAHWHVNFILGVVPMQLCRAIGLLSFLFSRTVSFHWASKAEICCVILSSLTVWSWIPLYTEVSKLSRKTARFQRRHLACLFIKNYVPRTFQFYWALWLLQVLSCQRSQLNVRYNISPAQHLCSRHRGSLINSWVPL